VTHEPEEKTAETRSDTLGAKSLGQQLREAREKKQVSVEKIAEELRIEVVVLQALEDDRLEDLTAAPVFVKGYIKQYGRQLGLAYEPLQEAYRQQVGGDDIELRPNRAIALRDERQITVWIVAALALALILVFLFVWWLGQRDEVVAVQPQTPAAVTAPARSAPPLARPLATPVASDVPPVAAPTRQEESVAAAPAESTDRAAGTATDTVESAAVAAAPAPPVTPAPRAEGSLELRMRFTAESWVEVTDARGEQLMYDLASPGSTVELYPVPPARVLLGNAEGVAVTVDGSPFAIPTQGRRGNLANFVIRSQD
jgi:cytoskeleton protein RodZ